MTTGVKNHFRKHLHGPQCLYCGENAFTSDHFPPKSYSLHGFILPACAECNSLAGTNYPTDLRARVAFVHRKLRTRYRKALQTPDWTPEEKKELKWTIRQSLEKHLTEKARTKRRLAWNAESYLSVIDLNNDFAQTLADSITITWHARAS